jgi:AcrR family transcriptional regulator
MPLPVDHSARRDFVIAVTTDLIAASGLEAVSLRNVAKAAGYSTSIITHYFEDKQQLMLLTYLAAAGRSRRRVVEAVAHPDRPLERALLALLPVDDESRRDWKVYFAFLASTVGAPDLARAQANWVRGTMDLLVPAVRSRIAMRVPSRPIDAQAQARRLLNFVNGTGILALLDPASWPPDRIETGVRDEIAYHCLEG